MHASLTLWLAKGCSKTKALEFGDGHPCSTGKGVGEEDGDWDGVPRTWGSTEESDDEEEEQGSLARMSSKVGLAEKGSGETDGDGVGGDIDRDWGEEFLRSSRDVCNGRGWWGIGLLGGAGAPLELLLVPDPP